MLLQANIETTRERKRTFNNHNSQIENQNLTGEDPENQRLTRPKITIKIKYLQNAKIPMFVKPSSNCFKS
jgi:hypothetical protein